MSRPDPSALYKSPQGFAAAMASYEAALQRLATSYQSVFVPTSFGATHVIVTGPKGAPPVVLLHGWNTNASGWWPQINALSHDYRIYAPDTIGHAGKSAPTRPPMRGPAYGQWLIEVLDALSLQRAAFAGSSGGAWLTFKLAARAPERIERAILLSPAGIVPIRTAFLAKFLLLNMITTADSLAARSARLFSPQPLRIDADHLRWQEPLARFFKGQLPPPTLPDASLRRLSGLTLALVGRYEVVFNPRAVIRRLQRLLPNLGHADLVPDAGHDMTYDAPGSVNERMLRFLRETEPRA